MKKGGTLTIGIEEFGTDWQITFADTGPGMSPQMVEKVFEPFQSGFEGGTGLGLAIVYQIVQAHEGTVWVRSKAGQGCTFVLRLRRAAEHETIPRLAAELERKRPSSELAPLGLIGKGAHA
jgi:signal transduction histidine kinase